MRAVNLCVPDGYTGVIDGTAIEADGHWWWMLVGAGYVAEDYLVFVRDVASGEALAPQLAGQGRIAFVRSEPAADGAAGERLRAVGDERGRQRAAEAVGARAARTGRTCTRYNIRWSPDGTRISYTIAGAKRDDATGLAVVDLHIVDAATGGDTYLRRAWRAASGRPTGRRSASCRGRREQQMGGGWQGAPGWVDVATGAVHLLSAGDVLAAGPAGVELRRHAADAHARRLCGRRAGPASIRGARGHRRGGRAHRRRRRTWRTCGRSGRRRKTASGSTSRARTTSRQYAVYDVAAGRIVAEAALPARDPNIGGRCGGGDMYLLKWSARRAGASRTPSATGSPGTNGVWTWDIASGKQTMTPAVNAGGVTAGPGGRFVVQRLGRAAATSSRQTRTAARQRSSPKARRRCGRRDDGPTAIDSGGLVSRGVGRVHREDVCLGLALDAGALRAGREALLDEAAEVLG